MMNSSYILLGLCTGIFSGFLGLGGGFIMIPGLVYLYGLTQQQAQGTSLAAMVPPITLLAAMRYYMSGNVKLNMAVFIAIGFVAGGLIGANFAQQIPEITLRRVFGSAMLIVALRMIFFK